MRTTAGVAVGVGVGVGAIVAVAVAVGVEGKTGTGCRNGIPFLFALLAAVTSGMCDVGMIVPDV